MAAGDHELQDGLIDELSALRFIVETEVAALAAELAGTKEKLRLFEAYEEMEANKEIPERAVEADILFHRRMFAAAHNKFLSALLQTAVVALRANFELATKAQHEVIGFLEEHWQVAEAINDRDPDGARACMRNLLRNNERHLTEMRTALSGRESGRTDD